MIELAFDRRIVVAAVLAWSLAAIQPAHAQTIYRYTYATQAEAAAACNASATSSQAGGQTIEPGSYPGGWCVPGGVYTYSGVTYPGYYDSGVIKPPNIRQIFNYLAVTPPEVNQATSEECQAFADDPAFGPRDASYTTATPCIGGCSLAKVSGTPGFNVTVGGVTQYWGKYELTGEVCTKTQETPSITTFKASEAPPASCTAAGSGQTFCLRNDGKHCYSASTGRQVCWDPLETGVKRDKNIAQKRCNGGAPCPAPVISGETITATGTAMTVTTTSPSVTNVSTVNNFTTTTAATQNAGEDTATTATQKSATGGSCTSSYICSGDAIQCAVLEENRRARCAVENGLDGIGEPGTCESGSPPTCSGSKCNADSYAIVLQQWKTRCAAEELGLKVDTTNEELQAIKDAIEALDGGVVGGGGLTESQSEDLDAIATATAGDGTEVGEDTGDGGTAEEGGFGGDEEIGGDGFDESGFGYARTCPAIPSVAVFGHTIAFNITTFCWWMQLGGTFVLTLTGIWCARYLGS